MVGQCVMAVLLMCQECSKDVPRMFHGTGQREATNLLASSPFQGDFYEMECGLSCDGLRPKVAQKRRAVIAQ